MGEQKQKRELYLRVAEERTGFSGERYFHINVIVCEQRYENHQWMPYGVDDNYDHGPKYSDLRIRCQGDERSQRGERRGEAVYGYEHPAFEDVAVDLRTAKRMLKT